MPDYSCGGIDCFITNQEKLFEHKFYWYITECDDYYSLDFDFPTLGISFTDDDGWRDVNELRAYAIDNWGRFTENHELHHMVFLD